MKKLEAARQLSFKAMSLQERAESMRRGFLDKYGSFLELAKMGLKTPRRKPNKLEMNVAKILGPEWEYVGSGKLAIGGLIPDFVHPSKKEVIGVLGCYYHSCHIHHPNVPMSRTAQPTLRESIYLKHGYKAIPVWEHEIKECGELAFKDAGVKDPSIYAY